MQTGRGGISRGHRPRIRRGALVASLVVVLIGSFMPVGISASAQPTIAPMCMASRDIPERVELDNGHGVPTESRLVQTAFIIGDTLYLAGPFTHIYDPKQEHRTPRMHLAACSLTTGEVLPWNPSTNGYTNWEFAWDGEKLFVGGEFTEVNGTPRPGLAALHPVTGAVLPWTPPSITGNARWDLNPQPIAHRRIQAMAIKGTTLYFGGTFDAVGGQPRTGLAAVDTRDGHLLPWAPKLVKGTEVQYLGVPIEVRDVAIWRDRLIAVGLFSEDGTPYAPAYEAGEDGCQVQSDWQVCGVYNSLGHMTAVNLTDGAPVPWATKPEYPVFGVGANAKYVYYAGAGKGPQRNVITQLDPMTGRCLGYSNEGECASRVTNDGNMQNVWATDDVVYVAGHQVCVTYDAYFSNGDPDACKDGNNLDRMYAFDAETLKLHPWDPQVDHGGDGAWTVVGDGRRVVYVGEFTEVERASHRGVVKFDLHRNYVGSLTPSNVNSGASDQVVSIFGANFSGTPAVSMGPGVTVRNVTMVSPSRLDVTISAAGASEGIRPVAVTNPDGEVARCLECFAVGGAPISGGNTTGPPPQLIDPGPGGYWLVASDGGVFSFGDATFKGSTGDIKLAQPIVGMTATPTGLGYWMVARDGGIFAFGDAKFHGSTGGMRLAQPIVGMTPTPTGLGYWLVASDGGIFSFGDAKFHGSTGDIKLVQPIVGMSPSPTGKGYWLVASDGGVFAFGDAKFHGSTGDIKLAQPVVGMSATPSGRGYWMVARDGGMFAFGDAKFLGSTGGMKLAQPILGMTPTATGLGYWLVAADGGIFNFGDAKFKGSTGDIKLAHPIVGMSRS